MKDARWWEIVSDITNVGDELFTPGRGKEGFRMKPFRIMSRTPLGMTISSGKAKIPLEKACFETIEKAFALNSILWLRVASLHENQPLKDSIDELIRNTTGSQLARGNYIASIIEHCGLVRYTMRAGKKGIELPAG